MSYLAKSLKIITTIGLFLVFLTSSTLIAESNSDINKNKKKTINFTLSVVDSKTGLPIQYVGIALKINNTIIAQGTTNPFGKAFFTDLNEGMYVVSTRFLGYENYLDSILVDSLHNSSVLQIKEKFSELSEVIIESGRINKSATTLDIITGRQVLETENFHPSPITSMTQIITQNLAGAVRAPTGEVHIRGQHGEFSYLVDGIPIPLGVFGGLNEIVDPKVISAATFYTAGFPAEFGGQIAALMDIQNRVPAGNFHFDFSTFGGSYLTSGDFLGDKVGSLKALNSNGQSFSLSSHTGKLGIFLAGTRQETDRRIDQPVRELFHNKGLDYFIYGKFDYLLSEKDYITVNFNYSRTKTEVPFDPTEGINFDDQTSFNAFQTVSYFRTLSTETEKESNLLLGAFAREGGMDYVPGMYNESRVFLGTDTTEGSVVQQNRKFTTIGLRSKYDQRFSHIYKFAAGFNYGYTFGNEGFRFFNVSGDQLLVASDFKGYDFGMFSQVSIHPFEWTRIDAGLRYDIHNAPAFENQTQFSPRLKLSFFIDAYNTISVSYDRLFMPTNTENMGAVAKYLGTANTPTYPEKDNQLELSYLRNWESGLSTKVAGFYKEASPGIDDQTLGSSTIRVGINVNTIKVSGIEVALNYSNEVIPLSAFANISLIHAYGQGPVTGGFIETDTSTSYFDLDHDQRLSISTGVQYQPANWFVDLSVFYGSGLPNGVEGFEYKTGLFDFNTGAKTSPAWILNFSGGIKFNLPNGHTIEPSIYINNLLDHSHLIKGAFFSGASFEARRNLILKLSYHI